jgi:hypothetical protein
VKQIEFPKNNETVLFRKGFAIAELSRCDRDFILTIRDTTALRIGDVKQIAAAVEHFLETGKLPRRARSERRTSQASGAALMEGESNDA